MEDLLTRYDRLISLHVSQGLSNCFTSVQQAIKLMYDDAAERVFPIDTRTCSMTWNFSRPTAACILPSTISIG
jgi:fatty acid-binding protein DegV